MLKEKHEYILRNFTRKYERGFKDLFGEKFDVEVIHYDTYIATKTESYKDEIKTDFDDEGLPPEKSRCLSYLIIPLMQYTQGTKSVILKHS